MPKTLWMPREATQPGSGRAGLSVTWTKTTKYLTFSGWYDSFVDIQGDSMTLRQFFDELGITEKDCAKAWCKGVPNAPTSYGAMTRDK